MNAPKLSLTREGLERAIAEMGLTQTSLADRLDVSARTMRRYVSGDATIPAVVAIAVHYLVRLHREAAAAALAATTAAGEGAPPERVLAPGGLPVSPFQSNIRTAVHPGTPPPAPAADPAPEEPAPSGNVSFSRSNFPK